MGLPARAGDRVCNYFVELNFNIPTVHYYVPKVWFVPTLQDVMFYADGDLDCDGIMSHFELRGTTNPTWGISSGTKVDPKRTGLYSLNEIE